MARMMPVAAYDPASLSCRLHAPRHCSRWRDRTRACLRSGREAPRRVLRQPAPKAEAWQTRQADASDIPPGRAITSPMLREGEYPLIVFIHGQRTDASMCPADTSEDYRRWVGVLHLLAR